MAQQAHAVLQRIPEPVAYLRFPKQPGTRLPRLGSCNGQGDQRDNTGIPCIDTQASNASDCLWQSLGVALRGAGKLQTSQ
jgi:hypothetical protein